MGLWRADSLYPGIPMAGRLRARDTGQCAEPTEPLFDSSRARITARPRKLQQLREVEAHLRLVALQRWRGRVSIHPEEALQQTGCLCQQARRLRKGPVAD